MRDRCWGEPEPRAGSPVIARRRPTDRHIPTRSPSFRRSPAPQHRIGFIPTRFQSIIRVTVPGRSLPTGVGYWDMARLAFLTAWVMVSTLGSGSPGRAQDLPTLPTPIPEPGLLEPAPRQGSPVETLETLTRGEFGEGGGQAEREIETDRDSFTPATTTTPRHRLISEAAYSFLDNRRVKETHSFPELLLRYGLTDRVELRFGYNSEVGGEDEGVSGTEAIEEAAVGTGALERLSTLSYGLKLLVTEQRRWIPRSSVIIQATTPISGKDTKTDLIVTWVSGWDFPNRWQFDVAVRYGMTNDPADDYNLWAPSAVLKIPLGEKWAVHAEYFGFFTTGRAKEFSRHYFSPGVHYLVTRNLEIGTRVGWGLNDQTPRFFVNTGFGWQY